MLLQRLVHKVTTFSKDEHLIFRLRAFPRNLGAGTNMIQNTVFLEFEYIDEYIYELKRHPKITIQKLSVVFNYSVKQIYICAI